MNTTDWFWYVFNTVFGIGLAVIALIFVAGFLGLLDNIEKD